MSTSANCLIRMEFSASNGAVIGDEMSHIASAVTSTLADGEACKSGVMEPDGSVLDAAQSERRKKSHFSRPIIRPPGQLC